MPERTDRTVSSVARMISCLQGAEEVVMVRARAEAGFLNDPVDIAELEVVLGGDVQLGGAALDELGGGALGRASGGLRWPQRLRGK